MLLILPTSVLAARDTVTFDFGWRHRPGLHGFAQPDERPPINTDPGLVPKEAATDYDDSDWLKVHLPHDGLAGATPSVAACPDGCSGKSYIPRHVLWYRKTFAVPLSWKGSTVWLDFDGAFRNTTVWLNGERIHNHVCGYTPFRIHLTNLRAENLLAVFVDPDNGDVGGRDHASGWWYEGGGLYRHVRLVRTPPGPHFAAHGLFAYSNITTGASHPEMVAQVAAPSVEALPTFGSHAILHVSAELEANPTSLDHLSCVTFTVTGPDGSEAAAPVTVPASGEGTGTRAMAKFALAPVSLWTPAHPSLYTIRAVLYYTDAMEAGTMGCGNGHQSSEGGESGRGAEQTVQDEMVTQHGFRSLRYDSEDGFYLNGDHFKIRGFCDHNSFAVVGMAVPERINLFRAQALRAVGGNGRRMSHNPPDPSVLDIYDRLGVVVMDENRLFANRTDYVTNMGVLVRRDRNHPSVVIWSFCNEWGCEGSHESGGPRFREIAYANDGTRPVLANMFTFGDLLSHTIDVQGFSHQTRAKLDRCHERLPHKPVMGSECCSCNTMRDEDEGVETLYDNPHKRGLQKSFNARCAESNSATNASDGVGYAVGTMVWTLFDYYGEPPVGPYEVSSTYGQFDLCGFPKAAAHWYRMQWLLGIPDGKMGKAYLTHGRSEVHLVESWESPDAFPTTKGNASRTIHAYTNARYVELFVNGKSEGTRRVMLMHEGPGSYAEWLSVTWEAGNLTAVARDGPGALAVATASRFTNGVPTRLVLTCDAPSPKSGTGEGLVLDGQDAALLRASIVDDHGRVVHLANNVIAFEIVSGPGRLQGTHNGDPHNHNPSSASSNYAYHGLVRAVVRVTSIAARHDRGLAALIDSEGPLAAREQELVRAASSASEPIVVRATSLGLAPAILTIPTNGKDVMADAAAAAGRPVDELLV